jgi:hypothetical protein
MLKIPNLCEQINESIVPIKLVKHSSLFKKWRLKTNEQHESIYFNFS